MKHTPGPWTINSEYEIVNGKGNIVVEFNGIYHSAFSDVTAQANAQLIAASPKLLQAAKKMVASLERCDDVWFLAEEWVELEAAIKEAEGNL